MFKRNYLNLIGLAYRARQCSAGEDTIIKDIRKRRVKLLILASDAGPQTKKKLTDKCKTYEVPYIIINEDKEALGNAIGKLQRVAIAILDEGFAAKIKSLFD
ncbi:L7Ae/L30e/S12e/Gadd45 family ribosomal protein [Virgibacillus halophilus]|uniref:Ribosomal L7Ae/L30e/S12e/Gadd45 family protein n=1 Tax=Tigheibacillus halophilus TaxID=361280 RepID=A0ABU5CAQ2_9BACI|nr:ribosomal L7Ae/L30e/S12e/Gadd45 family protein [Virgibacillus halophilus]